LVIGQTTANPILLLKLVLLITKAGLLPCCSCPDCGLKLRTTKSPFLGKQRNMQTTVSKWGNSAGLRLSNSITSQLHISIGDKLDINIDKGRIIIKHRPVV
jgi:hypothetical protein